MSSADNMVMAIAKMASSNPVAFEEFEECLDKEFDAHLKTLLSADDFGSMRFAQGAMSQIRVLKTNVQRAKDKLKHKE